MRIRQIDYKQNPSFMNRFYKVTQELDSSVMLSRGLIDTFGCTIPWLIMANNDIERKEKTRRYLLNYVIIWLTPFVTLPLSNRFAMKYVGKLTNKFWTNNHKAIHISNEFLKDTNSMMTELNRMSKGIEKNPIESLYYKINTKKQYNPKIDVNKLLDACGGNKEKLRQQLIKSKNAVFVSDCIFTFGAGATVLFANNEITKQETGQSGFSAEMSMADKEIVEKRAQSYERNKIKKYLAAMGLTMATAFGMSLASYAALYTKKPAKLIQKLRNNARYFDYNKGIYMSRLPFFIGNTAFIGVNLLGARNSTERKDLVIRQSVGDAVFFGGDLLLASLFANLSDRMFGTELRDNSGKISLIRKIFPKVKSIKQILEETKQKKIPNTNKKVASGIFWANMLILMVAMGYAIPTIINKIIRHDVEKDVKNNTLQDNITNKIAPKMGDFVKTRNI